MRFATTLYHKARLKINYILPLQVRVITDFCPQVFTTNISKQLNEYLVEYNVLQEEMASVQPQVDALHKIETLNKNLTEQSKNLMNRLEQALAGQQRLEKTRTLQQAHINRLEMQNRALESTVITLAGFVNELIEEKVDLEIPDEVSAIVFVSLCFDLFL